MGAPTRIKKIASQVSVVLDVPFAAPLVGFRPARLPPLADGVTAVPIGVIQSGQWAERAGLKIGDQITHVNGESVKSMQSADQFTDPMKQRPLRLTVAISVPADEITNVLQSFDWSARLNKIEQVRGAVKLDTKETTAMFDRVFAPTTDPHAPSSLFDATRWLGAGPPPAQPEPVDKPPNVQMALDPAPPVPAPVVEELPKPKPRPKAAPRPVSFTNKLVAVRPLSLMINLERGLGIPNSAGTLSLDYLIQPFSSEPFMEFSIVASTSNALTLTQIIESKPVEPAATAQSQICDADQVWGYDCTMRLSDQALTERDLVLVGKLMDYRRLEAARVMGVFAIKLDAIEVAQAVANVQPNLITLTTVDATSFDMANVRIKMSACILGKQTGFASSVDTPPEIVELTETTPQDSPSVSSSPIETSSPSQETETERVAPLMVAIIPQPTNHVAETPFQRAYTKAKADIKRGDTTPIRMQKYTLR